MGGLVKLPLVGAQFGELVDQKISVKLEAIRADSFQFHISSHRAPKT